MREAMKRWATIVAVMVLMTLAAILLSRRIGPSQYEQSFALIQVGMTEEEVLKILGPEGVHADGIFLTEDPGTLGNPPAKEWYFRDKGRLIHIVVVFDGQSRVKEKYIWVNKKRWV
jgi:hypothetical protein